MPHQDGFAVARRLREQRQPVSVIFLTMHKDEMHFNEALDLGVRGYLIKDNAAADVVDCIRAVAAGENYISPALSTHLLNRGRRATTFGKQQPGLSELTATESVSWLLAGYGAAKDSRQLCVSAAIEVVSHMHEAGASWNSRPGEIRHPTQIRTLISQPSLTSD
jgi:response regulator RpfG family c-di-GMP phosphodiesterase